MASDDRVDQARKQALADAEFIALRAQVHPRSLVDREVRPMAPEPWPHPAMLDLGEVQASKFGWPSEAAKTYHGTLARALIQYEVAYFILVYPGGAAADGSMEYDSSAYAVDLGRWEPRGEMEVLLRPPPAHGVHGVKYPQYGGMPGDFKLRQPWWLQRLRGLVDRSEKRRRRSQVIADPDNTDE